MGAPLVQKEREIIARDEVQRAAERPCLGSGAEKERLVRFSSAADVQCVQGVAVKLRLQPAQMLQRAALVRRRRKEKLLFHPQDDDLVNLHKKTL